VTASASDNVGVSSVSFFATPADYLGNATGAPYLIGTDATPPYSVLWTYPGCSSYYFLVTSQAADACGNVGTSTPVLGYVVGCGASPIEIFSMNWASQLDTPGAAGRVALNDAPLTAGEGRQQGRARVRRGDNRIDAELVAAIGKPGLWRFDLAPIIEPGSMRILAGEAVQVTDYYVVFRLAGTPGERLSFSFRTRY
jgi:hypothetical protein